MKLTFSQQHKSISSLPTAELPNFVVITGKNGSGKTHLLEAIKSGAVLVEDLPRADGNILSFDWGNFAAKVTDNASPDQIYKQREQAITKAVKSQANHGKELTNYFLQNKVTGKAEIADPHWLAKAAQEEIEAALLMCTRNGTPFDEGSAKAFTNSFETHRQRIVAGFKSNLDQYGDLRAMLESRAVELGISPLSVSEQELRSHFPLTWNATNTLQLEFANWFSAWHAAYEYNKINKYYHTQEGDIDRHYLEDEAFDRLYGNAPWEIANEVLANAGFRHRFTRPKNKIGNLDQQFQLRLEDPEDGTLIKTDELSSGEKILLAITLMLYQASGDLSLVKLPKLLLLDEVDAPLHPSFTRSLIGTLVGKFVTELNVAVIMTTHSPSTVALAPEESVFELVRKPREIRRCSVSNATQILSAGFVTVTSSDVMVITESSADPEYHQPVYAALVSEKLVDPNPSLTFIAASTRGNDGVGGGCSQVRNWAPKLHILGLERFRGLIDRDGTNQPDAIISVLGRYSIENYLYDPLTLAAYLVHRGVSEPFVANPTDLQQIRDFVNPSKGNVASYVSSLCSWLEGETSIAGIASSSLVSCDYLGFQGIGIPDWWLTTRGHDVETMIRAPLNKLGSATGRGALLKEGKRDELIRFQSATYPELISRDFIAIFEGLRQPPTPVP